MVSIEIIPAFHAFALIAERFAPLIGPSGCGKSTFLKTLNRMQDLSLARKVMAHDDVVDNYFTRIKNGIIDMIAAEPSQGEYALDLLMIDKYFERIDDHCTNIAEWVEFSVTGIHKDCQ